MGLPSRLGPWHWAQWEAKTRCPTATCSALPAAGGRDFVLEEPATRRAASPARAITAATATAMHQGPLPTRLLTGSLSGPLAGVCPRLALLRAHPLLTGCGSGAKSPAPTTALVASAPTTTLATTAVSLASLGKQYLAIIGPANTALDKMKSQMQTLPSSATGPDMAKLTEPVATASEVEDQALLRAPWPPNIYTDIKALVTAEAPEISDLRSIRGATAFTVGTLATQLQTDGAKVGAAESIIRADLGLPRPPS